MFRVSNGVGQGAVRFAVLFNVNTYLTVPLLRLSHLGYRNGGIFLGASFFDNDILLMPASRSSLQEMLNICLTFADRKHLKFVTNSLPYISKNKCIISKINKNMEGNLLLWVTK